MSSIVRSFGFIGVLKKPAISKDGDYEDWSERLYNAKSNLQIVYGGELVYLDYNRTRSMRAREDSVYLLTIGNNGHDPQDLVDEAAKFGLDVDPATIQPFNCIWHNGSDCPVNMLEKDEYLELVWSQG